MADQINADNGAEAVAMGLIVFGFVIGMIILGWIYTVRHRGCVHRTRQDAINCTKNNIKETE